LRVPINRDEAISTIQLKYPAPHINNMKYLANKNKSASNFSVRYCRVVLKFSELLAMTVLLKPLHLVLDGADELFRIECGEYEQLVFAGFQLYYYSFVSDSRIGQRQSLP